MHRVGSKLAPADTSLVDRLMKPAAFDYPVTAIECIDTHISWVILTDKYAYKIKKPVVLDFLNFGSLERRRHFCEEELRLNRPWAGDIYLDVVPITDDGVQARFGGDGTPVEYAVRMRRFDPDMSLDRQLALGRLTVGDMRDLAQAIATRHTEALRVTAPFRQRVLDLTTRQMRDNFSALEGHADQDTLISLHAWTERELAAAASVIADRFDAGFFRDCHGDLHLANLVRMPDGIRTFDCIEFNEDFRRIDVVSDFAFLVMDLVAKDRRDLAAHFLNRYLEQTGDYAGVALLDLYFVYRCMVRAKVAIICSQESAKEHDRQAHLADADHYCRLALCETVKPKPMLILMLGLSGAGKTWVSARLMAALPAIRLRSDVERKRLFGLAETARTQSNINAGIYDPASSHDVYEHLVETADTTLDAGHNVILDAAFLLAEERTRALSMADMRGNAAFIVDVRAPLSLMRKRLQRREQETGEASEAGLNVLEHQLSTAEPLNARERERTIVHNNVDGSDIDKLVDCIRSRANLSIRRRSIGNS